MRLLRLALALALPLLAWAACGSHDSLAPYANALIRAPRETVRYAYVGAEGRIFVIDLSRNKVRRTYQQYANGPMVSVTSAVTDLNSPYVFFGDTSGVVASLNASGGFPTAIANRVCQSGSGAIQPSNEVAYFSSCEPTIFKVGTDDEHVGKLTIQGSRGAYNIGVNPVAQTLYYDGTNVTGCMYAYNLVNHRSSACFGAMVGTARAFAFANAGDLMYVLSTPGTNLYKVATTTNYPIGRRFLDATFDTTSSALAIDPIRNDRLYVAEGDPVDRLLYVNPDTLQAYASIPIRSQPDSIAVSADGATAYVLSQGGSLQVIDTVKRSVVATISLGHEPHVIALRDRDTRLPANCAGRPHYVRLVPDGSDQFVVPTAQGYRLTGPQAQRFSLVSLDCKGNRVLAVHYATNVKGSVRLDSSNANLVLTARGPSSTSAILNVTATAGGGSAKAAIAIETTAAIYEFDTYLPVTFDPYGNPTPESATAFNGAPAPPAGVAYSERRGRFYMTSYHNENTVYEYDRNGKYVGRFSSTALLSPGALAFDRTEQYLYVTNGEKRSSARSILKIDLNGRVVRTSGTFAGPRTAAGLALSPNGKTLYTFDTKAQTLYAFDDSGHLKRTSVVAFTPTSLAVDPNTGNLAVANANSSTVSIYDSAFKPIGEITSASIYEPSALAFDPSTSYLYVVDLVRNGPHQVTAFDQHGDAVDFGTNWGFQYNPEDVVQIAIVR